MLNTKTVIKSPIFSTVTFVLIVFLIYACNSMSEMSLYPSQMIAATQFHKPAAANGTLEVDDHHAVATSPLKVENLSSSDDVVVTNNAAAEPIMEELEDEEEEDGETPDPLIPPAKARKEERMEWFRKKLPDLEVLKSTNRSRKFHGRVMRFFGNKCAIKFYMTWFSPARTFGPRDFLAVDTLMKANPEACLVLLSRSLDTRSGHKILKPLLDRGLKILAVTPDLPSLVKKTPAESWLKDIKNGRIDPGKNPLSIHLSDLIRLAVLYKYGGVYMDTDFIILKDFKGLRNALGIQGVDQVTHNWTTLNGAALVFDKRHPILSEFLREFAATFDGSSWGHNGPYLLTRVIKRVEDTPGYNVTILGIKAFYPVNWIRIAGFYKKPATEEESKWVERTIVELNNYSYGLHLWNKITRGLVIEWGSVIDRLIKSHCLICQDTYNS